MIELLSPAGSWDSLVAAVQNGADAVYMGFGSFNARRNAKNFSREEFQKALDYCHLRGVRVYLTLNTLLTDRELLAARLLAAHLDRPRFRIRWADVLAMLGASALFVWFLLIVMEAWAG